MGESLHAIAEQLARKPYTIIVTHDETTDGNEIYLASHPELAGCMAQGKTMQEAIDDLALARVDYIASLLEDGLTVPGPGITHTISTSINVPGQKDMAKKSQEVNAEIVFSQV